MRKLSFWVVVCLTTSCVVPSEPQQCFQQGDTLGWVTVTQGASSDTLAREPILAAKDFCLR